MEDIEKNQIPIYDFASGEERDESDLEAIRSVVPFAVVGATLPHKDGKRGRRYSWGFVDCDDPRHCDLSSLQKILLLYPSLAGAGCDLHLGLPATS